MRVSDFLLLGKKIGVGIVITLIPLGILTGGLWVSHKVLARPEQHQSRTNSEAAHEN
jgi:hypothetical protein